MPAAESAMFLPAEQEARLIAILRGAPPSGDLTQLRQSALFAGVAGPIALALGDSESLAIQELSHQRGLLWVTRIGRALDAASVPFLVLKGVPLGERYYNPPYLRTYSDLDFLIDPANFPAAHAAILALGYTPSQSVPSQTTLLLGHDATYEHPSGPLLELHVRLHSLFGIRPDARPFLAASIPQQLTNGYTVRVLNPEDEFVHLAAHAASHRWCQARWVYDIVLLLNHQPSLDWPRIAASTGALRLWPTVLLTCALLQSEWQCAVPLAALVPSRFRRAQQLLPSVRYSQWDGSNWFKFAYLLKETALCGGPVQKFRFLVHGLTYPLLRRWRER